MLFLGFSAGLPLALVFGTLSAWLREYGIDRSTIGHVSWVALLYSLKVFWSPIIDRTPLPVLGRLLGQRRSWMLVAQGGVIAGLLMMANSSPSTAFDALVWFAIMVAFCSATQDITIDAWRIEAVGPDSQGPMAGTYQTGYRLGMIVSQAGVLAIAQLYSWETAYQNMALCMSVGVITTLLIAEPERRIDESTWRNEQRVVDFLESSTHLPDHYRQSAAWFIGAVICPFTEFFSRNKNLALIILALIGAFRVSDITMGIMSMPFYIDMGYSKLEIASISKLFGPLMTISGALLGGALVIRYGVMRILLASSILVAITNLIFAWLATIGHDLFWLTIVISADNMSGGIAGTAFIAYLSNMTNKAYTATQYALFSSLMLFFAKVIGGFSGDVVEAVGYFYFYIYAALLGTPAIFLILYLMNRTPEDINGTSLAAEYSSR